MLGKACGLADDRIVFVGVGGSVASTIEIDTLIGSSAWNMKIQISACQEVSCVAPRTSYHPIRPFLKRQATTV